MCACIQDSANKNLSKISQVIYLNPLKTILGEFDPFASFSFCYTIRLFLLRMTCRGCKILIYVKTFNTILTINLFLNIRANLGKIVRKCISSPTF